MRYAHDFADKRRITDPESAMNRLYVVESTPTVTGAMADHRLPLRASEVEALPAPWRKVGRQSPQALAGACQISPETRFPRSFAISKSTAAHSLVIAGEQQPPAVHALAHAMNDALGNVGKTVHYTAPVEANPVNKWNRSESWWRTSRRARLTPCSSWG